MLLAAAGDGGADLLRQLLLDTNFMFLMYAPDGNPLAWFRDHVGYHWIGFPVLLVAVFALMDVPIMLKKRKEDKLLSAVK